ncbi:MAG: ABC transporter permease subunit [Planctomycetaceae bacterium]|nr:ABC transporter permease subunit [Planctomycetaceae bacterium]
MNFAWLLTALPLLRRELTELANRRRTYIIRAAAACVILAVVVHFLRVELSVIRGANVRFPRNVGLNPWLGTGGAMFREIAPVLFYAIRIMMPAMCCGSISGEKERNTLGTLLLTRLHPLTIVLEKLGSRLVPMVTFLLLSFPILAFVYSLGGVDTDLLLSTLWLLLCDCLLFGAIATMFSSWCRTTVGAFVAAYTVTAVLTVMESVSGAQGFTPFDLWRQMAYQDNEMWQFFPAGVTPPTRGFGGALFDSTGSLFITAVCLAAARFMLVPRAFVTSRSLLMKLFVMVDGIFVSMNQSRLTRGIEIIPDSNEMPAFDPIAWRERTRKSLGKARYLFRVLVAIEVPTLFICMLSAIASANRHFEGLHSLQAVTWFLAVLIVTIRASTLISSERSRETIAPLLSTPLTSREILRQKVSGIRRLQLVVAIPILTVNLTTLLMAVSFSSGNWIGIVTTILMYGLLSFASVAVLLTFTTWLALFCGLRFHSPTRSVFAALSGIAVWALSAVFITAICRTVIPFLPDSFFELRDMEHWLAYQATAFMLPWQSVVMNDAWLTQGGGFGGVSRFTLYYGSYDRSDSFMTMESMTVVLLGISAVSITAQWGAAMCFRWLAVRLAPRLFGRIDGQEIAVPPDRTSARLGNATLPAHLVEGV